MPQVKLPHITSVVINGFQVMWTYVSYGMLGAHKLFYPKGCSSIMKVIHNEEVNDI